MNILVKTASGGIMVRPDTTWERDNEDFYPPEFVSELSYAPVLFARISKPGRSVGEKFASRYYDAVGYGVLLYPENLISGGEEDFAAASCIDHTSFLPFPAYKTVVLGQSENTFSLYKNEDLIYETSSGTLEMIESAIVSASSRVYMRSGDIIAVELQARSPLCVSEGTRTHIKATFCKNLTMEFDIIM